MFVEKTVIRYTYCKHVSIYLIYSVFFLCCNQLYTISSHVICFLCTKSLFIYIHSNRTCRVTTVNATCGLQLECLHRFFRFHRFLQFHFQVPLLTIQLLIAVHIKMIQVQLCFFALVGFSGLIWQCSTCSSSNTNYPCFVGSADCAIDLAEGCFVVIIVFVIVFAILGLFFGFVAPSIAVQRILQCHYGILTKKEMIKAS